MKTLPVLFLTLMSLLFAQFPQCIRAQHNVPERPNIIVIMVDDLGWGDLGVFFQNQREKAKETGEPWMLTPHLDRMAKEGAQLSHHYCAAPVCAPSRASLLMGVSQGHANVRDNQFDKELEDNHTVSSVLRGAGYATALFGKWGLQGGNRYTRNWPAHPLHRGFDYFFGYIRHVDGHEHYPKEGVYRGTKEVWENRTNLTNDLDKCYTADLWTAATKRWIIEHKKGKNASAPFFVFLAYDTPHAVLELPTQAYPAGGGVKGGMQWLGKPGNMISTASGKVDSWVHSDYAKATYDHDKEQSTPEVPWPDTYKRYATSVRRIDHAVGDLMQLLKDLKIDSNTLIVFTSDNGPSLESYLPEQYVENNPEFFSSFGNMDGVKRDCWEGGIRVPTLARWPGRIPSGRVVNDPSASYDWLPTFTDAAGVPAPARTDGVSLMPSLTGSGEQAQGLVYIEYFNNGSTPDYESFEPDRRKRKRNQMQMIRFGDYAGVRYHIQSHTDDFEIYNVVEDPGQTNNLASDQEMGSLQDRMKETVLRIRRPDPSAPRPYDGELIPPASPEEKMNGVRWSAYAGAFSWIPDVSGLTPEAQGRADDLSVNALEKKDGVVFLHAHLNVPRDGTYTFYLRTDAGAMIRLHDALLIDADHGYASGTERKATVHLKAGLHPIKVWRMVSAQGKSFLDIEWEGPGMERQEIATRAFNGGH